MDRSGILRFCRRALKRGFQLLHRLEPMGRMLGQTSPYDAVQRGRAVEPGWVVAQHGAQDLRGGISQRTTACPKTFRRGRRRN